MNIADLANVPQELKDLEQWVCWRYEERNGKETKLPIQAKTGKLAESDNPETWCDFKTAVAGFKRLGCAGVGFMFSKDDPYMGADFDDCLSDQGVIADWAQEFIEKIDSYTEISPSHEGLKAFLKAGLNGHLGKNEKYKTGRIEVYDKKRFFTVTGMHLSGSPTSCQSRQPAIDYLLKKVYGLNGHHTAQGAANNGDSQHTETPKSNKLTTRRQIFDELRLRIESHSTSFTRPDGTIHCQGICHDGVSTGSNGAVVLFKNGAFKCMSGCPTERMIEAFDLPKLPPKEQEEEPEESLPQARPWLDIKIEQDDKSVVVGPGRWLTRGSGCLVVGPTGAGKSTLCATLAFTWGLGRDCLGFHPLKPLKSLIVQAEDDDGDLADMRGGVLSVIQPTEAEKEILRNSVLVVTERARTGVGFLRSFVLPLLKQLSPDILWLNPLSAYFGADLNDQEQVAKFFRNTLNPILAEAHCLAIVTHHIAKPSKERKDWTGGELAYLGAGSADLANWAREIIALRATAPGLFEMACTKRWRKLDWYDSDGKRTNVRMIAHGKNGQMVWRDADAETLSEQGAALYSDASFLALIPSEGMDKQVLIRDAEGAFAVCQRTAQQYVNDACRLRRRMVNGKLSRVALLSTAERPRKEVYPGERGNRPVVWVKRIDDEG